MELSGGEPERVLEVGGAAVEESEGIVLLVVVEVLDLRKFARR